MFAVSGIYQQAWALKCCFSHISIFSLYTCLYKAWFFTTLYTKRAKQCYLLVVRKCKLLLQKGLPPCVGFPTLQMPAPELATWAPSSADQEKEIPDHGIPPISLGSLPWDGMNHSVLCWLGCSLVPSQERLPWAAGEKEGWAAKGILQGGIWRGAFMLPPWRPRQEAGQDMSHFPWDISKAEETDATTWNSRETCTDVKLLLQGCADLPESPSNPSWTWLETMEGFPSCTSGSGQEWESSYMGGGPSRQEW